MQFLNLGGDWTLQQASKSSKGGSSLMGKQIAAHVPGDVVNDLLNAGEITDPFYRDDEYKAMWIGETDWTYSRTFDVSTSLLNEDRVLLRCDGLDTLATIRLNGNILGHTDNMFRAYEWDVRDQLREGENRIEIRFDSAVTYSHRRQNERHVHCWDTHDVGGSKVGQHGWIRKEQCNFGWDWNIRLVTTGIWKNIGLVGFSKARLDDVLVLQNHSRKTVGLTVKLVADMVGRQALTACVSVRLDGEPVDTCDVPLRAGKAVAELTVKNPRLWWPLHMGEQPLYEVDVALLDADGKQIDHQIKRIGLRTMVLDRHKDPWGECFQFVVNGKPFFAKGANWIPVDAILARRTPDDYRRLLQDAMAANMNMLRVWGGGIYEDDLFYDLCDEMGICIWQDFMFACSAYPSFDEPFMKTVAAEATDAIRRIRHHPCMALWCGNNELEQGLVGEAWSEHTMSWDDYKKLFDKLLPSLVRKLDPQRDYWPSSPHSPVGDRTIHHSPESGDAHLWSVWHGGKPFEWYHTSGHRFSSEFGFQSFPEPKTVYGFTQPEDYNVTSYVMEHHQRSKQQGNTAIIQQLLNWFRLPLKFDKLLWLTQILQGLGIKYGVEHWRRSMPRTMGTLYWQINDTWPVASWSSIDYHGRWKALHYMARRFYEPVLVSCVEDAKSNSVDLHVTSDLLDAKEGQLRWMVTDCDGTVLREESAKLRVAAQTSKKVRTLQLKDLVQTNGKRNLIVWMELDVAGQPTSQNIGLLIRPKHLLLRDPELATQVSACKDGSFDVTVTAKRAALWTWLELKTDDAKCSDNFFHVRPSRPMCVKLRPGRELTLEQVRQQLQAVSLFDTYQ